MIRVQELQVVLPMSLSMALFALIIHFQCSFDSSLWSGLKICLSLIVKRVRPSESLKLWGAEKELAGGSSGNKSSADQEYSHESSLSVWEPVNGLIVELEVIHMKDNTLSHSKEHHV